MRGLEKVDQLLTLTMLPTTSRACVPWSHCVRRWREGSERRGNRPPGRSAYPVFRRGWAIVWEVISNFYWVLIFSLESGSVLC